MPLQTSIPRYRRHKQSGQAIVTLRDDLGNRRDVLLGRYGTRESKAEYERVITEWLASGRRLPDKPGCRTNLTLNELAVQYLHYAEQYYRHSDGTPTSEYSEIRMSLRPLCHLYRQTTANDFGPLALKAVRQLMIAGYEHPRYGAQPPLCRRAINNRVERIRRMFKWAVANELVPGTVLQELRTVEGLRRGRSTARETAPVKPVAEEMVNQTLPYMPRQVAAMTLLQLLTGMRPGEVVIMRAIDIDMTGGIWLYRPGSDQGPTGQHKTAHHGHQRIIALGPQALEVLKPFLKLDVYAYLFSPAERMEEWREELRRQRKSKVQPSQQNRGKENRKRAPGKRYRVSSYEHAIHNACDKAFPPPEPLARQEGETKKAWLARLEAEGRLGELEAWRKAHRWHPHQLRHTTATKLRREYGLDVARVVLGHRSPQVTEIYAEIDMRKAVEAIEKLG